VILPSFLDPALREAKAKSLWLTEKMAKRDAAYQAYLSLYRAGLVNDNLMPTHCDRYNDAEPTEKQGKLVQASECFDPWVEIAQMRRFNLPLFKTRMEFSPDLLGLPPMVMLLPKPLPCELKFDLFWNEKSTMTVSLRQENDEFLDAEVHQAAEFSYELLFSVFWRRMNANCNDLVALFWPKLESSLVSLESWLLSITGRVMAKEIMDVHNSEMFHQLGVAQDVEGYGGRPFIIENTLYMAEDNFINGDGTAEEVREELYLQGTNLPKRTDFLHPVAGDTKSPLHHTARQCAAAHSCSINRLPAAYSKFALFVPSIIHKIEILFVADKLSRTILAPVKFENLHLVVSAISASSAREGTDYQRFEFLGDSLLKFHSSVHLTAMNPIWHEGLLSCAKDNIVSNARLSKAALDLGLDAYILTKAFTGIKWRPRYVSDLLVRDSTTVSRRELSSKVLADVVEAIIGAAYMDGGIEKSSRCLSVFLPEVEWIPLEGAVEKLYQSVPTPKDPAFLSFLPQIEALIGYAFTKGILPVEALTHPCSKDRTMSYQRLEFLGDSVLDHLVVQELFKSPKEWSHQDMHLMRTTLVNADFLAFLCMGLSLEEDREDPVEQGKAHLSTIRTTRKVYLWQFMRHSASWEIATAQQQALGRYEDLRDEIHEALVHSTEYPWALLLRLEAGKFFSDLIESILGAIFVDSHGSLETCRQFLHRIGLMSYMRRVTNEEVKLLHPRNRLHHAAGSTKVSFDTRAERLQTGTEGSKLRWTCRIRVGDEDIVEIGDGINKGEVETRASAVAAAILESRAIMASSPDQHDSSSEMDITAS
jgi:dsRNA-specific ribonuclease